MQVLDNITWNALVGPHAHFAIGTEEARRYDRGFPAFAAFPDPLHPRFSALEPYCARGENFYSDGWSGRAPDGWSIDFESTMYKMVWRGGIPDDEAGSASHPFESRTLTHDDADQAVALANITKPGPFGPRNLDLGDYFGIFDGDRLIAMAGERLAAGSFREVSAVCTHPEYQGRGLARTLMMALVRRQTQRGETPFLHVMRSNDTARGLYQRMGFSIYRESVVRVVSLA